MGGVGIILRPHLSVSACLILGTMCLCFLADVLLQLCKS